MLTLLQTEQEFDAYCARRIVDQLKNKPDSVIGLSTGRTTGNMHRLAASGIVESGIDCTQATVFGLDEVVGVSPDFPGACVAMIKNEFTYMLDNKMFLMMLPTGSEDFAQACDKFKAELNRRGGIDLLILGLGENGHLGFNQPGTPFGSTCHVAEMDPVLEERLSRESGCQGLKGVTLGIKDIMHARNIMLVAKGSNKSEIACRMLLGPVTEQVPASVLQLHPSCEFVLDAAAASNIINVTNGEYNG